MEFLEIFCVFYLIPGLNRLYFVSDKHLVQCLCYPVSFNNLLHQSAGHAEPDKINKHLTQFNQQSNQMQKNEMMMYIKDVRY